jgi:hypothetical protein
MAERLSWEALVRAHDASDFERMARIALPLLEARRQKRQMAVELSGGSAGTVPIIDAAEFVDAEPEVGGCLLFQPPLIGADARNYRIAADAADVPVFILTREPMTRDGLWPVVSVGEVSLRTKLAPPQPPTCRKRSSSPFAEVYRVETSKTKDNVQPATHTIPMVWFEAAAEQLGDAAISRVDRTDAAAWQVEELLEFIEAFPLHEKLHQRLVEACGRAMREGVPEGRRPRFGDDPYCF